MSILQLTFAFIMLSFLGIAQDNTIKQPITQKQLNKSVPFNRNFVPTVKTQQPVAEPKKSEELKSVEQPQKPEETKAIEQPKATEEIKTIEEPKKPEEIKTIEEPARPKEIKTMEEPKKPRGVNEK